MKTTQKANEHLARAERHLKKMREILKQNKEEKVYNSIKGINLNYN